MTQNLVLAIETSCDETAAAVVAEGKYVLSSVVSSQVDIHARYGGVVPEIASRAHVDLIAPVIAQALVEAGIEQNDKIETPPEDYKPDTIGEVNMDAIQQQRNSDINPRR